MAKTWTVTGVANPWDHTPMGAFASKKMAMEKIRRDDTGFHEAYWLESFINGERIDVVRIESTYVEPEEVS